LANTTTPDNYDAFTSKSINVDQFKIESVLGIGSFGKVLLVQKKDTGKLYAMKVLKKEFL
jgi:serum/glucocorticoid-regulated kinase 2